MMMAALHLATAAAAPATAVWGEEPMKLSSTGPSSTLPSFFFMAQGEEGGDLWTGYNFSGGVGEVRGLACARPACAWRVLTRVLVASLGYAAPALYGA